MKDEAEKTETPQERKKPRGPKRIYYCDRCGVAMREQNCKVVCPNCGNRFDCSDLSLYFD